MARIRSIKPEFFLHEDMAELPALTRLLFIGLWTLADRRGRLEDRPKRIKAAILPYENADVDGMLSELERAGFVCRYEVAGIKCISIPSFEKHQHCHVKEAESDLPEPPERGLTDEHRESTVQAPDENRTSRVGREGKGTGREQEGKGMDLATGAAPPPRTESKTAEVWRRYSAAYLERYGTEPVRNAKVNGQLANIVDRIGHEDAPHVAEFYVGHNSRWYVERGHSVECLLKDAEKLRTEWATGQRITATRARQLDRTQSNGDVFAKLIAEAERG